MEQTTVKLALEPEWEAKFEPNSFGFRPGRSCHDAIVAIFNEVKAKAKYVLDADISKCFDRINHDALLRKLNTSPTIRRQVRAWLKAGVMDGSKLFPTPEGTPQGGTISPLLANIALHGMENRIKQAFPVRQPRVNGKCIRILSPVLIRYADDFVIMHEDLTVVQRCQQIIADWLKDMGLELKPSKTRLTHTLHEFEGNVGFDFIGFNIRQFPTGKNHSIKGTNGKPLGFKPLITPSKEKVKEHLEKIGEVIKAHKGAPQLALITKLNPIIRGWARYYSTQASKATFTKVDHLVHQQLRAWADYRHPQKNKHWVSNKYWLIGSGEGWKFAVKGKMHLLRHSETPIVRHIKVQGNRSPYDGDWIYWSSRMGQHPEANKRVAILLKRQKGKCAHCGMYFKDGDLLEIHHVIPRHQGGKDEYKNFQLLHRHCHDIVTALDAVGTKELKEEWLDANPF